MKSMFPCLFLLAFASCAQQQQISGTVYDLNWQPIAGVEVLLTGDAETTATTNAEGVYFFDVLPGTYTITPIKREPVLNRGIDSLDAAKIQQYILTGQNWQWSPRNWIACDITGDYLLTSADVAAALSAWQGTPYSLQYLQGLNSINWWRFVPLTWDHAWFGQIDIPDYPQAVTVTVQDGDALNIDFTGFVRGDVDGNAN